MESPRDFQPSLIDASDPWARDHIPTLWEQNVAASNLAHQQEVYEEMLRRGNEYQNSCNQH